MISNKQNITIRGRKKIGRQKIFYKFCVPDPAPLPYLRLIFLSCSHQVCWWKPWVRSSDNCLEFWAPRLRPSAGPIMKTEERGAKMCLPAWNAAGAESWHQLAGKGLASKGCLQDNRVFSLWCIYSVGLKFCQSNSCCKNIVLNMLRTVKRMLLMLHFAQEKCGNLWYVWERVSALSEAVL